MIKVRFSYLASKKRGKKFNVFLEDFYNSLCLRKFERKNKFEVTNWQPFHFLCFAVNRYQRHSS